MQKADPSARYENPSSEIVVIGSSLGGPATLRQIFSSLPSDFPAPIVVVQHLSGRFSTAADFFLSGSLLPVEWACDGTLLRAGRIYLAPPNRHLRVTPWQTLRLSDEAHVSYARPAVDVLFSSAAECFGPGTLAVVLSGRLYDGTAGASRIRQAGGVVLAQDPSTCRAPGMPQSALRSGAVDFSLPPEKIASALISLTMVPGARELFGVRRLSA